MAKIALFGAAGAIGESLANTLRQRGQEYRVVGRDRARLEKAFGGNKAEIITWNPDGITALAVRGVVRHAQG